MTETEKTLMIILGAMADLDPFEVEKLMHSSKRQLELLRTVRDLAEKASELAQEHQKGEVAPMLAKAQQNVEATEQLVAFYGDVQQLSTRALELKIQIVEMLK